MEYSFSLVGNPNVGKTSLYNRVTHSLEHVGNWHGVTVDKVSKTVRFSGHTVRMTDLPGLYSLSACSREEGVSRDSILRNECDLLINVCEVNNLARNLYLTLQLLELGAPVVLVVNMMDELEKRGKTLDSRRIEDALGVPVMAMSAKYRGDAQKLMQTCLQRVAQNGQRRAQLPYLRQLPLDKVQRILGDRTAKAGLPADFAAVKVLENDAFVTQKLALDDRQRAALAAMGDWQARVAQARYEYIDEITADVICDKKTAKSGKRRKTNTARQAGRLSAIDRVVLNKYLALPVFFAVMACIFFVTFGLVGGFFTDLLGTAIDRLLYAPVTSALQKGNCPAWIVGLIGEGIIRGVGGVLVFLPQIVSLFFFLALLEDSGYISRVAFMTDGIFRKIGLSGRSVFSMLMGFGCSATAVLTARGLEDETMRKKTVLLTPFLSCSARLPVYATIAAAFFAAGSPLVIFGMYVLGAAVALALAALFEAFVPRLKSGKLSFIMEMPPYRLPTAERVLQLIWHNTKVFLIRVGTTVFLLNVIVWVLSNFSLTAGYTAGTDAKSILQVIGGVLAPVFRPFGFGNWKAVTALLSGLVAKESVISSIAGLGGAGAIFTGNHAPLSALTFMVFTLLYVPCFATLAAIAKEAGRKWMWFSFALHMVVAYVVCFVFYTFGLLCIEYTGAAVGAAALGVVAILCVTAVKHARAKKGCGAGSAACAACARVGCGKNGKDNGRVAKKEKGI